MRIAATRRPRRRPLLAVIATLLFVAIGLKAYLLLAPRHALMAAARDRHATLRVCLGEPPSTLDPAQAASVQEAFLAMALFEGLFTFDPRTLDPRPALAERWEVSDDGRTWTFQLRDARWSDGEAVTAEDFAWSWRRARGPALHAPLARLFDGIREATARDARTLVVSLDAPMYWLPSLLCYPPFLPVQRRCVEAGDWTIPGRCVGNGPFVLRRMRWKDAIELARSSSYRDAASVRLEAVEARTWSNPPRAVEQYLSGAADWVWGPLPPSAAALQQGAEWRSCPRLAVRCVEFDATARPFSDLRVRRAFSLSVDREELVRRLPQLGEAPAASLVPPGVRGYEPVRVEADPEQALSLLAEAGYAHGAGFPLVELSCPPREPERRIAESLAAMWKERLGVSVTPREETEASPARALRGMRLTMLGADCVDPRAFLAPFARNDALMDELLLQSSLGGDPSSRAALLQQAERQLVQGMATVAPLTFPRTGFLLNRRVKGIWENGLHVHPLKDVWLEPEPERQ